MADHLQKKTLTRKLKRRQNFELLKFIFKRFKVLNLKLLLPGWKTSYLNLVTTSETKFESAFAKNGTEATSDLQL